MVSAMAKKKKDKKVKKQRIVKEYLPKNLSQTQRSPISLCMIVKNEERFLEDCLKSVQGLVGEIVIVDTGSTDRTVEIAQEYGCRLFQYEWKNDFAAARNFGLKKCTLPWILYLDADERLYHPYHQTILKEIKTDSADAYYLKVYSPVSGILGNVPHVQAYPRLFKKLKGVQFEGKIHEQITPSLKRVNARFKYLDVTIEHLGYAQDDQVLKQKIKRNLKYLYEQIQREPNNAYAYFQLGQTLLIDGQTEKGIQNIKKALNFNVLPKNLTATSLLIIGNEYFKRGEIDQALVYINKALSIAPRQRVGYFIKSECMSQKMNWKEALFNLKKIVENSNIPFSDISIEKNFDNYLIEQRLGLYYFNMKDYKNALNHFGNYLIEAPNLRFSFLEKWVYAWKLIEYPEFPAKHLLNRLVNEVNRFDRKVEAGKVLAGIAEKINDYEKMKHFLQIVLELNPQDAMALYYMGNFEMAGGNFSKAQEYYRKALAYESHVWEIHYNLAVCYVKQSRYYDAVQVMENALPLFPEKRENISRLLTGLYAKVGNYEKLYDYLNPIIQSS